MSDFRLLHTDPASAARRAEFRTNHGTIQTPVFMPVGTQGTVKGLTPSQVKDTGAQILLGNTYHLNLRPGREIIRRAGGLHRFMGWDGPILTDSGGFQVFSLAKLRTITDEGIRFQSHLDGKPLLLDVRDCLDIQDAIGSDIAMVLDECPPWPCERAACEQAVTRTLRWAREMLSLAQETGFLASGRHLFAINQGSVYEDLRLRCAEELGALDFPGHAIGGVSVGEPEEEMLRQVGIAAPRLPLNKPRYVMGVGTPTQLLKMIALGADMFDCVMPTRLARHGCAFTPTGTLNLKNERFKDDHTPLVEGMDNLTCRQFTRAYLRHLVQAGEMLGGTLLSLHNLHFFADLMSQARQHLEQGDFTPWSRAWIARYEEGQASTGEVLPDLER